MYVHTFVCLIVCMYVCQPIMMKQGAMNVVLPAVRTEFRKKSISSRGARTYYELPDSVKQCKSLIKLKKMLRTDIL